MGAAGTAGGVYREVLGASFSELHPRLRGYFSPVPAGAAGHGTGVFERVGTRPAWLRPVIGLLFDGAHVLTGSWATEVPFTVENTPTTTDAGVPAVAARRRIALPRRSWTMIDEISAARGGIRDLIGSPPRLDVLLDARVSDGALTMRSRRAALLMGRLRMPLPRFLAPAVELTERWDDAVQLQRVSVTVRAPLLGTIYEYAGTFRYAIEETEATA